MNRTKIENVLIDMGIPASIKGFRCIADAVEYIDEHGEEIRVTKELYPDIAKKQRTTAARVERAIRHALEIARSEKGDYKTVEKYIGFMDCTNFNSLVMLHKRIKQECEPELQSSVEIKEQSKPQIPKSDTPMTASEFQQILHQEFSRFLTELRGIAT